MQARDALREALEPPKESKLVKGKPPEKKLNLAQKEERAQKAVVAVVRAAEFMLTLTNISAKDVPDADASASASDWSDPYAAITLLDCGATTYDSIHTSQLSGCTEPLRNAKHPRWEQPIKLWVPPGTAGALSTASRGYTSKEWDGVSRFMLQGERALAKSEPTILIRIMDRDLDKADDEVLGEATLAISTLGMQLSGVIEDLVLSGGGKYADSKISFSWTMEPYTPTPPSSLALRSVSVEGLNPPVKAKTHDRLYSAETSQSGSKKGPAFHGPKMETPRGQYLRFSLLEVGDDLRQPTDTIPHAKILGVDFYLPQGSRRAPLIKVQLFDNTPDPASGLVERKPIATSEHRIKESDASDEEVKLHYNFFNKAGAKRLKIVTVRFSHSTKELEAEIVQRLSRVGIVPAESSKAL